MPYEIDTSLGHPQIYTRSAYRRILKTLVDLILSETFMLSSILPGKYRVKGKRIKLKTCLQEKLFWFGGNLPLYKTAEKLIKELVLKMKVSW